MGSVGIGVVRAGGGVVVGRVLVESCRGMWGGLWGGGLGGVGGGILGGGGPHVLGEAVECGGGFADLDVGGELGEGDGEGLGGFAFHLRGDEAVAVGGEKFEGLDVGAGARVVGEGDELVGGKPEGGVEGGDLVGGGEGVDELFVGGHEHGHVDLLYSW